MLLWMVKRDRLSQSETLMRFLRHSDGISLTPIFVSDMAALHASGLRGSSPESGCGTVYPLNTPNCFMQLAGLFLVLVIKYLCKYKSH